MAEAEADLEFFVIVLELRHSAMATRAQKHGGSLQVYLEDGDLERWTTNLRRKAARFKTRGQAEGARARRWPERSLRRRTRVRKITQRELAVHDLAEVT